MQFHCRRSRSALCGAAPACGILLSIKIRATQIKSASRTAQLAPVLFQLRRTVWTKLFWKSRMLRVISLLRAAVTSLHPPWFVRRHSRNIQLRETRHKRESKFTAPSLSLSLSHFSTFHSQSCKGKAFRAGFDSRPEGDYIPYFNSLADHNDHRNHHSRMPQIDQHVLAIDVIDIAIIGVSPVSGPWIRQGDPVSPVQNPRLPFHYRGLYAESMLASEVRAKLVVGNPPVGGSRRMI